MEPIVRDVMTTHVVAVTRNASYKEMAVRLRQFRVSAFPVLDEDGKVIGVVSAADMLAKEAMAGNGRLGHHKEAAKAAGLTAGDLMTRPAVTVSPKDTVEHAARLMYRLRLKRLPVVSEAGRLVGIISRTDLLAVFDRPDEEIRREILDEVILNEFLEDPRRFAVTVRSGVVTLEGRADSAGLARDIARRVRHVQGVVAVRDRLSYPEGADPAVTAPLF